MGKDVENEIAKATKENKPVLSQLSLWNRTDKLVHTVLLSWITHFELFSSGTVIFNK